MKVGIITLYDSINYGAFLQAYALQQALIKLGHIAEFINLENEIDKKLNYKAYIKAYKPASIIYNRKRLFNYKKAKRKMNISYNHYKEMKEKYDVVIIGSDEMWNITNATFNHLSVYFGNNINADIIATYAISCGQATLSDLKSNIDCIEGIKNIKYLAARDKNTLKVMREISGREVEYVLDPTLLYYDFSEDEINYEIKEDYLVVYTYGFNNEQIDYVKKFAKDNNLKIVSPGFNNKWCDVVLATGPFEFLSIIKNAKYVITDTFHGTLFSIIYKKNFAVLGENKIKINDILEQLNLQKRIVTKSDMLSVILSNKIDYNEVNKDIENKRDISKKYLIKVLGE